MKKVLKISGISLGALLLLALIAIVIALNFLTTSKRITPIVNENLEKYIGVPSSVESVDLSIFSTFPNINVCISNLYVFDNNSDDTVAFVGECCATVDAMKFLFKKEIVVEKIDLNNGFADLNPNRSIFDIGVADVADEDTSTVSLPLLIDLCKLTVSNVDVNYVSYNPDMKAELAGLELNANGSMVDYNVNANLSLAAEKVNFSMDTVDFLSSSKVSVSSPLQMSFTEDVTLEKVVLGNSKVTVNELGLDVAGQVDFVADSLSVNMNYNVDNWNISDVVAMIPKEFESLLEGINVEGGFSVNGEVKGMLSDSSMPKVSVNLDVEDLDFAYSELPLSLNNTNCKINTNVDLTDLSAMELFIISMTTNTEVGNVELSGKVSDIMGDIRCDFCASGNFNIDEMMKLVPDGLDVEASGSAKADLKVLRFSVAELMQKDFKNANLSGSLDLSNYSVNYEKNLLADGDNLNLAIEFPGKKIEEFDNFATLNIKTGCVNGEVVENDIVAEVGNADILIHVSDFMAAQNGKIFLQCNAKMGKVEASMDTLFVSADNLSGNYTLSPSRRNSENDENSFALSTNGIKLLAGESYEINSEVAKLSGRFDYDSTINNIIVKWNPNVNIYMKNADIQMKNDSLEFAVNNLKSNLKPEVFSISDSEFKVGSSVFELDGYLYDLDGFIEKTTLLTGEFNFVSTHTDLNELMWYVNKFAGDSDSTLVDDVDIQYVKNDVGGESVVEEQELAEPFMVPLGVDLSLNTNIENLIYDDLVIEDLGGKIFIKDSVMVLDQMAFTSNAARMQLTALYRTPRSNHLFAGVDFHLLDISVEELIGIIPYVDTIVPMLKSFAGKGEFHFAFETYMKSDYTPKMSTLKGAAAFNGQDLVVLDNETFSTIAKVLQFDKKSENKIDSLSVEMTIFRNEIDVYPFMISMDKYSAIIGGRHNLDMSFDYNISIMDPVLLRIGVDVKGRIGDLKFVPTTRKYKDLYRPEKQNVVMNRTLELKNLINESLRRNVKY